MIEHRIIDCHWTEQQAQKKAGRRVTMGSTTPQTDKHFKILEGQPKHMALVVEDVNSFTDI